MLRFLTRTILTAIGLGVAVSAVPGLTLTPYADETVIFIGAPTMEVVVSYLVIAAVFGVVNAIIGNIIRVVAFPIYILTLGLISLVVNAGLLYVVNYISDWLGFGLHVASFSQGVIGALVLSLTSWFIGLFFKPLLKKR